jgi:hypothetical protein
MRGSQFALPDDTLVGMEGLQKFASRDRLWTLNPEDFSDVPGLKLY